ncbi:MAG: c-type cytochrome [Bacteroidia bacterium]
MTKQITHAILTIFLMLILTNCNNNKTSLTDTVKLQPNDPFKNTIVPSESFDIDAKKDNVVEGNNGTVLVFPKGCFKNSKGEIVEENVKVELSEALTLDQMILSNLTTTSNGKQLETDGMIYFNATANGAQLSINKDIPIHIEIPTNEKKPGMMAYKGVRDEKGNMNWMEPKELDNFLVPVDINLLDFLPEGFQNEVDKGMPFKNHKIATEELTDSLYYSLAVSQIQAKQQQATNYNEPYYNKNKKIVNGKYTKESFVVIKSDTAICDTTGSIDPHGIDPAVIKVIKSEKYQNTLIATREFEARLKVIFKTCNKAVLETYINNLNKNLYELDSMAAKLMHGDKCADDFYQFSQQRLTNVKEANKYSALLKGYYEKQLSKVKAELEKNSDKVRKALNKKNEAFDKVADDYKKLLWKREKYRMEAYSFEWTETGWINIDNGTLPKVWSKQPLEITVENGKQFDRVYTYVVYTSIKSLYRLNTSDNLEFYAGNDEDKEMLMPKQKPAVAIAIGYKGETPSLAVKEFITGSEPRFTLSLSTSTLDKVKEAITPYEKYAKENKISKDLEFMDKFYKEEQWLKEYGEEIKFLARLWHIANPCRNDLLPARNLFNSNCRSCHSQGKEQVIGPGLADATKKYSMDWIIKWTRNSSALIKSGDKDAVRIFEEFNKMQQPAQNLSDGEIYDIFCYIDDYNSHSK